MTSHSSKFALAFMLVVAVSFEPASADIVTNSGFESGDFTGWSLSGAVNGSTRVSDNVFDPTAIHVHSGTFGVVSGPGAGGTVFLAQDVATTVGGSYIVSFSLANNNPAFGNAFSFNWNGIPLINLPNPGGAFGFTDFSVLVHGTGNDSLQFALRHDGSAWGLDDVAVSAIPAPGAIVLLATGLGCLGFNRRRIATV